MSRTNTICPICTNTVDFLNDESFIIEYMHPDNIDVRTPASENTLFFHPACFITLAGKEWAQRAGYKIKKALNTFPIEVATDHTLNQDEMRFEYRDVKFKAGPKVRVHYQEHPDGQEYFHIEKVENK